MQGTHTKETPEKASEKPNLSYAWLETSIAIDNATAVAELIWQSMSDNDWRELLPDGFTGVATFADHQRRALDAVIPLLRKVSNFFNEYGLELPPAGGGHGFKVDLNDGKISEGFSAVLNEYNWAFDAFDELCTDRHIGYADPGTSRVAKRRYSQAEARHLNSEIALAKYEPTNSAELRLKVKTIMDLRANQVFPEELLDYVVASLKDFGRAANG